VPRSNFNLCIWVQIRWLACCWTSNTSVSFEWIEQKLGAPYYLFISTKVFAFPALSRPGWRTCGTRKIFLGTRYSLLAPSVFFFLLDQRLYILKNTRTHKHTQTHICDYVEFVPLVPNILTRIGSGAKCWLDICLCGSGLAVTGRICYIGQYVLQSSFRKGSSSSPVTTNFLSFSIPGGGLY